MTKQEVLDKCTIEGTTVKLPDIQLDRALYMEVQKALKGIGGKWNRKAEGFIFTEDPSALMGRVQAGEKVNLKKEFQEFFTPNEVAEMVVQKAVNALGGKRVFNALEPSAGDGALVSYMRNAFTEATITAVEIQERNCRKLDDIFLDADVCVINQDFLAFAEKDDIQYQVIIANPPFTKNQDIKHVHAMLGLIAPGGVVSCIMSTGWLRNNTKVCKEFRKLLGIPEPSEGAETWARNIAASGGGMYKTVLMDFKTGIAEVEIESLSSGMFKESGTQVATAIVTIKTIG